MSSTLCLNDDSIGPNVVGCRGDFDFTQKFERVVLSIIPASIFIVAALIRLLLLVQSPKIVSGSFFKYSKLISWALYTSLQLAILVLLATSNSGTVHRFSIAASALVFTAAVLSIPLSSFEHEKAIKPSALIGSYLSLTLLFDVIQSRTAWLTILNSRHVSLAGLFSASIGIKVIILCLEAISKTRWMDWERSKHSPEESMNMYTHGAWSWVNRLLFKGNRTILDINDLYPLDSRMAATKMHAKLESKLRLQSCRDDPSFGLVKDLARTLAVPFLLPILPRLAFTAFKFCQPLLINTTLRYLSSDPDTRRENIGYGLIGAAAFVYTGIAVSNGFWQYWNIKALYQIRGCLCAAIYRKTVTAKVTAADDSAALTLMSTDIERIILGGEFVHEVWASMLEVAIGLWLLEGQVGASFAAPVVTIVCCGVVTFGLSPFLGRRQKNWMEAIEHRVGLTANAIANMKLYKLSGMSATVADHIQKLRVEEIRVGKKMRWLMILCAAMGFFPFSFSPTFTYAVTGKDLDLSTIFTSFAYIMLVTSPLILLFQVYPQVVAALTCLQRIQKFLVSDPRADYRQFTQSPGSSDEKLSDLSLAAGQPAFSARNVSAGWAEDTMVLKGIDVTIPASQLTLIVGPVACGKSTLCKTLLGEMPFFKGTLSVHLPAQSIAYCEQVAFLYNASLKENIIGQREFDQARFDEVIKATLLDVDIALLPQGSDTKVGSDGIMLSGGQRQRVSVARALYSEANVLIFDDVLSGLDTDTDAELFRRVFGPSGILRTRNATVIVCTHSVSHLPQAEHIVALGTGGAVAEQGSFQDLVSNKKYIHSLGVHLPKSKTGDEKQETSTDTKARVSQKPPPVKLDLQDKSRQTGDRTVYVYWFKNVHPVATIGLVVGAVSHGFLENFSTIWLRYWSEDTFNKSNSYYIAVLGSLRAADIILTGMTLVMVLIVMISFAGSRLHHAAIQTVSTATLGFFTSTDTGTITNLFSQDMTLIDGQLLMALINFSINVTELVGSAGVIAAAAPWLAIGYPFLLGVLYYIQRFYLRTSRQLRLLELEAKSPLYTNFIDTIKGVATVRAYGWETELVKKNDILLDTSQRPAYLLAMIQEWLSLVIQLLVAGLAVILFTLATQLQAGAGLTGASLISLLSFGLLLFMLIRSFTQLETCIGAVNRLRTFSNTVVPEDKAEENIVPPMHWPSEGRIEIRRVSARYGTTGHAVQHKEKSEPEAVDDDCVLREISLSVSAGQKVALCGRTGSGKSSLILLLAKLLEPLPSCEGNTHIDDLPLQIIQRAALRERIIAIPQDAVFLPDGSSVCLNVDPQGAGKPEECLAVLQTVGLSGFVDDRGGLEAGMSPDDLSAGQKQLFSLARAILRKRVRDKAIKGQATGAGGILLLDEVSSNVDKVTDRDMQEIIKVEFSAYTIVMVSHRLQMVVDYFDSVVVLDKGAVVETGAPTELIQRPGSRFGELWAISNGATASSNSLEDV